MRRLIALAAEAAAYVWLKHVSLSVVGSTGRGRNQGFVLLGSARLHVPTLRARARKRTFSEPGLTTGRLAQHSRARPAEYDSLRVREHGRDVEAPL